MSFFQQPLTYAPAPLAPQAQHLGSLLNVAGLREVRAGWPSAKTGRAFFYIDLNYC